MVMRIGKSILRFVQPLCVVIVLAATLVLFAGLHDFGIEDVTTMSRAMALPAIIALAVAAPLALILQALAAHSQQKNFHEAAIVLEQKLEQRLAGIEKKTNDHLDAEHSRLVSENQALTTRIEEFAALERERAKLEFDQLKAQNSELKEQLESTNMALNKLLNTGESNGLLKDIGGEALEDM